MEVLHLFDPWKSKLCTCPPKYSLDPYTGCSHRCFYCYASSYIKNFFKPRPKKDFIERLKKDVNKMNKNLPVSMSNSSDPYQHLEKFYKLTRKALEIFSMQEVKVQIVTKSSLVERDLDVLKNMKWSLSMTVTTMNDELAKSTEPGASLPSKRLRTLEKVVGMGFKVSVRIDPIIPKVNDKLEELKSLVKELSSIGVSHVIASTYKVRPDNWSRFKLLFPKLSEELKELYFKHGEKTSGYFYLPKSLRLKMLTTIKKIVEMNGMSFAACREGFPELQSAKTCDGTHLIGEAE